MKKLLKGGVSEELLDQLEESGGGTHSLLLDELSIHHELLGHQTLPDE